MDTSLEFRRNTLGGTFIPPFLIVASDTVNKNQNLKTAPKPKP